MAHGDAVEAAHGFDQWDRALAVGRVEEPYRISATTAWATQMFEIPRCRHHCEDEFAPEELTILPLPHGRAS